MDAKRILIVGPREGLPTPEALGTESSTIADAASTVQEAIKKLTDSGYDAVVCWAERQDELAALIRIRKARPDTPILLLTPQADDAFHTLARQLGAALVLRPEREATRTAGLVLQAIRSGQLAKEVRSKAEQAREQAEQVRALAQRTKELTVLATTRLRPASRLSFIPLVVEGDPEAAFRMVRALEKADLFAPLPILRGRDEAIRYLDDIARPGAPILHPLPTVFLVAADLPEDGAVHVLKHARSLPALAGLPVILMGPPGNRALVSRAYEAGANSYVERPSEFSALARCIETLKSYWGSMNHGPGSF